MQKPVKPYDNKRIFWDVNADQMDHVAKASFIIERVFERGDVEDIRMCRRFYGEDTIKKTLLNAKYLPEIRMHLAAAVINQPIKSFRCYILRHSTPTLFPY